MALRSALFFSLLLSCAGPAARIKAARALEAELDRALSLRSEGKQEEGLVVLEELRRRALAEDQPVLATRALNRHGDLQNDLERTGRAAADYEAAYAEAQARGDWFAMGRAAHDRALLGEGAEPDPSESEAVGLSPESLAVIHGYIGLASSADWYLKAVDARRKANDRSGLRLSLNNLAISYFYSRKPVEAQRYYEEAIELARSIGEQDAVYRIEANLALLFSMAAEGVFDKATPMPPWAPPVELHPDAEARARRAYADAIADAQKVGRTEDDVCGVFGSYGERCVRLSPSLSPEEGLVAFFETLAIEVETEGSNMLRAGTLYLRAADAVRAHFPHRGDQALVFEQEARSRLKGALERTADACEVVEEAHELCSRLR